MNLNSLDKKYLGRVDPSNGIEIASSKGSMITSVDGKEYIDFISGWCVGNIGWGNEEVRKAIRDYKGPEYVHPSFLYKPWVELAELLAEITPGKLIKSFRTTGGTETVDIALRAANIMTKRHQYISIEGSYHGDSIGAMSIANSEFRQQQKGLLFRSHKIKPPLNLTKAAQVEKILARKQIAAVIMEPIICNLAVEIPDYEFMQRIQQACKKYGSLLIIDEVATGFGRTGKLFAAEHFDLQPDMMCLAKAISGGYGALGALVTTKAVAKAMKADEAYYSTYGWHPVSVVAAIANINYLLKHKKTILENTLEMGRYFEARLSAMPFKSKPEIKRIGLAIGVKLKNEVKKIVERARKNGLLIAKHSKCEFTLFPALNISEADAKRGLDILEQCV